MEIYILRQWNEYYTKTVLFDDFSGTSLDSKWWVTDGQIRQSGIMLDLPETVEVFSGKLELTMISCPSCTGADYAGGEINTIDRFKYGIFECRAKFAERPGSWPAAWIIGDNYFPRGSGLHYANEIDFAEFFCYDSYDKMEHNIHHYHDCPGCDEARHVDDYSYTFYNYNTYHIYKCIWTPNEIRYFIDGTLQYEVENTNARCDECNQEWFPQYDLRFVLSQQITNRATNISVPQTSYFDYVSVKEFFPTPEITIHEVVCTSDTAVLNTENDATNISWSLSPTSLFSGTTSDTGKIAAISVASGVIGEGKITYSFEMPPNGETFTIEKSFWVGIPENGLSGAYIVGPNCIEKGSTYNYFHGSPYPMIINGADWYNWSVHPYDANIVIRDNFWNVSAMVDIGSGTAAGFYTLRIKAENDCGENSEMAVAFFEVPFTYCGGGWYMMISPNPTSGETTVSIESNTEELGLKSASSEPVFDENTEWELEIYSPNQVLKEKKTKLKGKSTTIQTQSWKEGVYVVHVKYKDKILIGKLVVKK